MSTAHQSPDNHLAMSDQNPFQAPSSSHHAIGSSLDNTAAAMSESMSATGSSLGINAPQQRYFRSRRVRKGEVEKPWLDRKDPKEKWVTIIPLIGIAIGLGITAFLIYDGLASVSHYNYCPLLDEDFSKGLDPKIWTKEVELGGYGSVISYSIKMRWEADRTRNGQFEVTTGDEENVFVKNNQLVIKPTLQDAKLIEQDNVLNLLTEGTCTSTLYRDCVARTNMTNGTIINPVKSGRINTKIGANIKYGRVEVEARLPDGDWLWPAIWMLPRDSLYGPWPRSGEIDIAESRGNNYTYPQGGNNIISSTLHWGPATSADGWYRNNVKRSALHTTYSAGFHKFGIEWSPKYIFSYVDTRLLQVMYVNFDTSFWSKGKFPTSTDNGTALNNPWVGGTDATPFDQNFYLVLNVAVGGTNGWFADNVAGKPWINTAPNAPSNFWNSRNTWYPTWKKNGQMTVKSVRMWQQQGFNGC